MKQNQKFFERQINRLSSVLLKPLPTLPVLTLPTPLPSARIGLPGGGSTESIARLGTVLPKTIVFAMLVGSVLSATHVARAQSAPGFTELTDKAIAAGLTWTGGTGP